MEGGGVTRGDMREAMAVQKLLLLKKKEDNLKKMFVKNVAWWILLR